MNEETGKHTLEERLPTDGRRTFILVVRANQDGTHESNTDELNQLLAQEWAVTAISSPSLTVTPGPTQDLLGLVFLLARKGL
jgi:hypothetical protein